MRFADYITEGWVFPDKKTLDSDFAEYKKKEDYKWKGRAETIGARFPIFIDREHFEDSLRNAKVVNLDSATDSRIQNRSHTGSLEGLKNLVGTYHRPRDVDRIVAGLQSGAKMPMPIVLKGSRGMWIMAGNTRLDTTFILGYKPKVLMVDVSK